MKHNVRKATFGRQYRTRWAVWKWIAFGHKGTRAQRAADKTRPHRIAAALEKAIPGLVVDRPNGRPALGGACPWQLDGTYQGKPCYMRYRHDTGGMTVWNDAYFGDSEHSVGYLPGWSGNEWDGYLNEDEVVPFATALVATLAPPTEENVSSQTAMRRAVDAMVKHMKERDAQA